MSPPKKLGEESSWAEYEKLVLVKLDEMKEELSCVKKEVTGLRVDVAVLKFKSGMWGALAGLIPALAALIYVALR